MRTYAFVKMIVNGKVTSHLDIYRECNTFRIFEYDMGVFEGGYLRTVEWIEDWKKRNEPLVNAMKAKGWTVTYEQTIG